MNDNDQKLQMAKAWDQYPIGRATKIVWISLKHGLPAGTDGRDLIVDISVAETLGIKGFGDNVHKVAPPNHYVLIPPMNGNGGKLRYSRDLISVMSNSYAAHLARLTEAKIQSSGIPLDTAIGLTLRSAKEVHDRYPDLKRREIIQRVILESSRHLLKKTLARSDEYASDLQAGLINDGDIRTMHYKVGAHPIVSVSTPSGGQKSYSLEMDEMALSIIHGEMSGTITEIPSAPSLDFPLQGTNYSVIFLPERGEVIVNPQWGAEEKLSDDWSGKLVFR